MIVPINHHEHWLTGIIQRESDTSAVELYIYNSIQSTTYSDVSIHLMKLAKELFPPSLVAKEVQYLQGPNQEDSYNCGLFLLKFAEKYLSAFARESVCSLEWESELDEDRQQILYELFNLIKDQRDPSQKNIFIESPQKGAKNNILASEATSELPVHGEDHIEPSARAQKRIAAARNVYFTESPHKLPQDGKVVFIESPQKVAQNTILASQASSEYSGHREDHTEPSTRPTKLFVPGTKLYFEESPQKVAHDGNEKYQESPRKVAVANAVAKSQTKSNNIFMESPKQSRSKQSVNSPQKIVFIGSAKRGASETRCALKSSGNRSLLKTPLSNTSKSSTVRKTLFGGSSEPEADAEFVPLLPTPSRDKSLMEENQKLREQLREEVEKTKKLREEVKKTTKFISNKNKIMKVKDVKINNSNMFFLGKRMKKAGEREIGLYSKIAVKPTVKPNHCVSRRTLARRATALFNTLIAMSGTLDPESLSLLILKLVKNNSKLFLAALKKGKIFNFPNPLSAEDTHLLVQYACNGKWFNYRRLVTILNKLVGWNPLASEKMQRMYSSEKLSFFADDENLETGTMTLKAHCKPGEKASLENCPYVRVKNLKLLVEYIADRAVASGQLDLNSRTFQEKWQGKIWLVQSADHGGDLNVSSNMKYCLQVLDGPIVVYAVVEASDTLSNQQQFHSDFYYKQFEEILENGIQVQGRNVPVFLFTKGDMKQAYLNLGLGGQSCVYPSRFALHTRDHYKSHCDGRPHNKRSCYTNTDLKERSIADINRDYSRNVSDNGSDTRKNSKHYNSVVSPPLLPLQDVKFSVIGPLHFKLKVVKDIMEEMKRNVKNENYDEEMERRKSLITKDIRSKRNELKLLEQQSVGLADDALEKHYLIERIKFSEENNHLALNSLAMEQNNTRKILNKPETFKFPWICPDDRCLLTNFDIILWKECEDCFRKFHSYCIAQTDREARESINAPLHCLDCHPRNPQREVHEEELNSIKEKQRDLATKIANTEGEIKRIEDSLKNLQSEEEVEFDQTIRDLGINIQEFHSNSLVGNHCDRLISGREKLLKLIHDEEKRSDCEEYLECVEKILETMNAKRWIEDSELKLVSEYCERFGVIYPKIFKNITVKVCEIIFHLPDFLAEFRTLGFLSEEDTESLHREFNAILRPLYSIRDRKAKLLIGLKRLCLRKLHEYDRPDFATPAKRKFKKRNTVERNREKLMKNRMM